MVSIFFHFFLSQKEFSWEFSILYPLLYLSSAFFGGEFLANKCKHILKNPKLNSTTQSQNTKESSFDHNFLKELSPTQ
jgi:hypothetical protein